MMTIVDEIGRSRYVSLTTYRKDGTGVATPVWHVLTGGELLVISEAQAWKIKRIRNNSHVVVTVCDIRGKIAPGAPATPGDRDRGDVLRAGSHWRGGTHGDRCGDVRQHVRRVGRAVPCRHPVVG